MVQLFENASQIIGQAAQSLKGILALVILVIAALAYLYFDEVDIEVRLIIFVVLLIGAGLFAFAVIRSNEQEQNSAQIANPPVFGQSSVFQRLRTFDEKKSIAQNLEQAMTNGARILTDDETNACAGSSWDLDRIGLYIWERHQRCLKPDPLINVRQEFQRIEAQKSKPSLMPMYYSLESYLEILKASNIPAHNPKKFNEILNYVKTRKDIDKRGQVKNKLNEIIQWKPRT